MQFGCADPGLAQVRGGRLGRSGRSARRRPDECVFGKRALAGLIRVHDTSPVEKRPGLSSADGRYRAGRMPGDRWFAQKRRKLIAGRRNVRPACRARSHALRRASPETGCWRQLYQGEERWNALVKVERCSRPWMLTASAPGPRLTRLKARLRAGHRLAAGKRNENRARRAAGSLPSIQARRGEARIFVQFENYCIGTNTISRCLPPRARKNTTAYEFGALRGSFFLFVRGLVPARNRASDAFSRAPAILMRHEQKGS